MSVSFPVAVSVPGVHFAPSGDREPCAEGDQCEAGRRIDDVTKVVRHSDAGKPDNKAQHERRPHMSNASLESRAGRLCAGPTTLTREQSDRHPMIGNDRMQHAHGRHGRHKQKPQSSVLSLDAQRYFVIALNSSIGARAACVPDPTARSRQVSRWS